MAVLYRKYRPQIFKQVVGQKPIIQTLQNQIASGQISHAYLFVGSRGVGKTSVARILAKAVNCENRQQATGKRQEGDACGDCDVCKQIEHGNFLDLVEIDAASNTGVDNIRELIEHVRFSPSSGKYKVFIIDEVHMLSKGAFNALLKTLEEPPVHAIFVLATTEASKVPATIISRTMRFDFKRLSVIDIENHLVNIAELENAILPNEALKLIAEHCEGGLRDALSLLDKVLTLGNESTLDEALQLIGVTDTAYLEKLLLYIADGNVKNIPVFIDDLLEKGVDFLAFNRDYLSYLRKILIIKITGTSDAAMLTEAHLENALNLSSKFSENELLFVMRLFLRSLKEQISAPSAELPVLLAAIEAALTKNARSNTEQPPKPAASIINNARNIENSAAYSNNLSEPKFIEAKDSTAEAAASSGINISIDEVLASWPKVIAKLKNVNGPLAHLLRTCAVSKINGARIIVSVKYKFHKENLEHPKNQEIMHTILQETYGQNLAIAGEIIIQEQPEKIPTGGLSDALKVFGGELIE